MASSKSEDNCSKTVTKDYLGTINRLSAALESLEDVDSLIRSSLEIVSEAVRAARALVLVYHAEERALVPRTTALGFNITELAHLKITLKGDRTVEAVLSQDRPEVPNGDSHHWVPQSLRQRPLAVVPMRLRNRATGMLLMLDLAQDSLSSADMSLLIVAANQIASVLEIEEEKRLCEGLREANSGWRELLAQISNELRAPLTPILTWTQILGRQARLERRWQKAIEVIQRNTREQARLIDDLLDVTGYGPGLGARPHRIDVKEQVQLAAESVRSQADAHQVAIKIDVPNDTPAIDADPRGIQQIVANLLRNTLRATPRGGFVALSASSRDGSVSLTVTDPSGGFEAGKVNRTVELMRSEQDRPKTGAAGMGVGLALIKQLAERQGGTLRATSPGPGRGASFEVRLPQAVKQDQPRDAATARHHLSGMDLLIIEDHDDSREALAVLLEAQGAQVRAAASGEEGIAQAMLRRPDVVLCDLAMPGIDGYEVAKQLRKQPGWSEIPIFALTAHGSAVDIARTQEAGFSAHLLKPIDTGQLVNVIGASCKE